MIKLSHHWVADIFPLNESDIDRLAEDIKANGQRNPIIVLDGAIIDGRTRYAACKKLGIAPLTVEYQGKNGEVTEEDLLALSWSLNRSRRQLTSSQIACAVAELSTKIGVQHGGSRKKGSSAKNCTWLAKIETTGSNRESVRQARELLADAPELFRQVKAGELTVGAAHEAFRKSKDLEKQEVANNNLAEIASKDPDLAEQIETGKLTVDQAKEKLEEGAKAKRERETQLHQVATGVFVALAGMKSAMSVLSDLKASIADVTAIRQPYQLKEDVKRIKEGMDTLSEFLSSSQGK